MIQTKYGILNGVENSELYPSGSLKSAMVSEYSVLKTEYGDLIPNYEYDEVRKKYRASVCFDEAGELSSIYLQKPQRIRTKAGIFPAELLTFYPGGSIKRLFPLYGQINGYWTEEDEYKLAEEQSFFALQEKKTGKVSCFHFYPDGNLKSVTLWPQSSVTLLTNYGEITTKFGFELTEQGKLRSMEPAFDVKLDTPNGVLKPFPMIGYRLHAERNSLAFDEDGKLVKAATLINKVKVKNAGGEEQILEAVWTPDPFTGHTVKRPLELLWTDGTLQIRVDEQTVFTYAEDQVEFV